MKYFKKIIALSLLLSNLTHAQVSEELKLNKGLPVMIDNQTELNNILFKNMTVIYTFQLKNIDKAKAKGLREQNKYFIELNACNDEGIQCFFKKDLDVNFVYKIDQEEILNVNVNKDLCLQLSDDPNSFPL